MGPRGQRERTAADTAPGVSRKIQARRAVRVLAAAWGLAALWACPNPHLSNGIRPGPKGSPAVLLVGVAAGGVTPLACYDDLWVALRGPHDCADLVPPGAALVPVDAVHEPAGPAVFATGPELVPAAPPPPIRLTVTDRGPGGCGVRLQTDPAPTGGLWLYDPDERVQVRGRGEGLRFDLDDDGDAEWLVRLDGLLWLESPRGGNHDEVLRLGGCEAGPHRDALNPAITNEK